MVVPPYPRNLILDMQACQWGLLLLERNAPRPPDIFIPRAGEKPLKTTEGLVQAETGAWT